MEWHELRDALAKDSKLRHESRPEYGYARIVIDLGDAENVGTNLPFTFSGDQLAKIKYDGSATGTYFRLNNKHAQQIYAAEFRRTNIPFTKIYLTNPTAQAGKTFSFYVGSGIFAAVQPSTGSKVGLVNSDGADINPAQGYAEDEIHVSTDKGVLALAVRKTAPVNLSDAVNDYEPLQINEGNLWVRTKIDGGGELQIIKEELEKIVLDQAAIEVLLGTIDADTGNIAVDQAAIEVLITAGNADLAALEVDLAAIEVLLSTIDADTGNIAVDQAAIEVLITAGNADLAALEVDLAAIEIDVAALEALAITIDADTGAIKTAVEKMDDYEDPDFPDHARVITPLMDTDVLIVTTTGATDTIACAAGHHLEIFGFILTETLDETIAGFTGSPSLALGSVNLWSPQRTMVGVDGTVGSRRVDIISGIRVAGADNTALTLTNYAHATGGVEAKLQVVVFYKDITD